MKKLVLTFITAIALTVIPSAQAISIINGGTGKGALNDSGTPNIYPSTILSGFDASAASKIVVTISTELGFSDDPPSGVSFDSDPFTQAVTGANSIQNTWIFYLDASDAGGAFGTGNLVVEGTGDNDYAASWLFLSGTADGVGATNSAQSQSVSLTTTSANSFIVVSHANNNSSGTAQSPLTGLLDGPAGSAGGGSGYLEDAGGSGSPGTYSFTGGSSRPITVAAEFTAVPEPSAFALLAGCFGFTWVMLRRR